MNAYPLIFKLSMIIILNITNIYQKIITNYFIINKLKILIPFQV